MSSLTQLMQFGRGLIQLPNATVEVLPDGTTLTFNASNQLYIPDGAITTNKIADANITTAKIADGQVTKAKMTDTGRAYLYEIPIYNLGNTTIFHDKSVILYVGWKVLVVEVFTFGITWIDDSNHWEITLYTVDDQDTTVNRGTIVCASQSATLQVMAQRISSFSLSRVCRAYITATKYGTISNLNAIVRMIISPTDTLNG